MAFRPLEKLINLGEGYRGIYRVDGQELLLLEVGGERYLFDRHCPHAGHALDDAAIDGETITCPRHGLSFRLSDGCALSESCPALRRYDIVYEGNTLGIDAGDTDRSD